MKWYCSLGAVPSNPEPLNPHLVPTEVEARAQRKRYSGCRRRKVVQKMDVRYGPGNLKPAWEPRFRVYRLRA